MSGNNGNGKIDFAARRKTVSVYVPELETTFHLRTLSIGQWRLLTESTEDPQRTIKQLAMAIVDESGNRIYTTDEDIRNLDEMTGPTYGLLMDALNELHGVSKNAADETIKN